MIYEDLKHSLIADFNSIRNNYYLTYGSAYLLNNKECTENLIGNSYQTIDLTPLGINLRDKTDKEILIECFLKSGLRTTIRELFEVIHVYCKQTNQSEKLKQTDWFHFIRLLRNATAHDFRFVFQKKDIEILPITWNEKTITKKMNQSLVTLHLFSYQDCWKIINEIERFVNEIE